MDRATQELASSVEVHMRDIRNEANERIAERYQMRVMPLALLLDGAGRELWRREGCVGLDELRAAAIARSPDVAPDDPR